MSVPKLFRLLPVLAILWALPTADARAQGVAQMRGRVVDAETGDPIADVTVRAEMAADRSVRQDDRRLPPVETTSGDDGRFSMIGLVLGPNDVTVTKEGYETVLMTHTVQGSFDPIVIEMLKEVTFIEQLLGREALAGHDVIQLTANLEAADAAFNSQDFPTAIAGYKALLEALPQASIFYLPLGHAHRAIGENEEALLAYKTLREADPENEEVQKEVQAEIQRTERLMSSDAASANSGMGGGSSLTGGLGLSSTKEDFYNLGELAFANGDVDRAQGWFEKAAGVDPSWVKPRFKLALVALNKGDIELAKQHFQQVVELDPASESQEGAQAKATLAALP